ncbi:MAG: flagellar hook-associated protein FlgK [Oscillospiraceae bacterium]|nr:flagellar hook-associated protein FlgK [Oscillospiraceae bacterium]
MASSFMGLYVQREALVSAQKALDITGSNISNSTTEGYSRQRVDVCSVQNNGYNLFYNTSVSMGGQGVDNVGITQYRDALIDDKVRGYTTSVNEYSQKKTVMSEVETALDNIEAAENGFAVNLAKFKEALQSFSSDNSDRQEIANVTIQAAQSVVQQLNYMNARIDDISQQTLEDANTTVGEINTLLRAMGELNEKITTSYVSMGYISAGKGNYIVDNDYGPLELKDMMHVYIDKLSQYGNVNVEEQTNGSFTVSFAGQIVVHNEKFAQMAMTSVNPAPFDMGFCITNAGNYDKDTDTYSGLMNSDQWVKIGQQLGSTEVYVRDDVNAVDVTGTDLLKSGTLRAYLDVYNGDGIYAVEGGNTYQGIEYYRDMLNSLAKTMTEEFNAVYEDFGFTVFTFENEDGNITEDEFHNAARNFRISQDWLDNPSVIAQPEQHPNNPEDPMDELNNDYINKMLGVIQASFKYGYTDADGKDHFDPLAVTFENFVAHISDNLGTQVESNNKILNTTEIMLESSITTRDEIMGVSIYEEGINMMNYQKWYNAIARMVTTLDEALDKIINGMGIVGL